MPLYIPPPHTQVPIRLSLTSATPVTTADVTAATTLYATPTGGNQVALYNGYSWNPMTFSERSLSLAGLAANTNHDVFLYDNAGTLALEATAWSGNTTRATALALQDQIYVKSGWLTRRYLGTFRTTGTIGQCEDSLARRFVWNMYNRVARPLFVFDGTNSWTYTTATWRQANTSAANQVEFVLGLSEDPVTALVQVRANNTNATFASGIGLDSTTANSARLFGSGAAGAGQAATAWYADWPGVGYHYLAWLEISQASGTTTWYGDNGLTYWQSGMVAEVMA